MENKVQILCTIIAILISTGTSTYVSPSRFLDLDLFQGTWINQRDLLTMDKNLFEGGWVWTETGNLLVTNVCRARRGNGVTPGELLNGTCYISGKPTLSAISGVTEYTDYSVLMKMNDEVYDWVAFGEDGEIPQGVVVGGIRDSFEPLFICRKVFNGTAGQIRASKAVLGNFSPRDGKCYYELEFGTDWIKFDLSFTSEHFQLLVLRARGKPACSEPRKMDLDQADKHTVVSHKLP